jgi:hypothetical protein
MKADNENFSIDQNPDIDPETGSNSPDLPFDPDDYLRQSTEGEKPPGLNHFISPDDEDHLHLQD